MVKGRLSKTEIELGRVEKIAPRRQLADGGTRARSALLSGKADQEAIDEVPPRGIVVRRWELMPAMGRRIENKASVSTLGETCSPDLAAMHSPHQPALPLPKSWAMPTRLSFIFMSDPGTPSGEGIREHRPSPHP